MSSPERRSPARVLIVETRELLARHYWLVLKEAGRLDSQWTTNIATVKATMHTFQPHLLIIGDDLKDHCGLELCGKIRQISTVPLILITSSTDTSQEIRCLNSGADDCMTLPIEPPLLLARVFALLRRSYRYSANTAGGGAAPRAGNGAGTPAPLLNPTDTLKKPDILVCAACNHRNSRVRFELAGSGSQPHCPSCGEKTREAYSLG